MAVAVQNPTALSHATTFRPKHGRTHSRSPSRSPIRKAQFVARELDPLLNNLSPDSTLRALQETETISKGGAGQDALAKSITDASTSERELGIRAAVAGQKLKQWKQEITQWSWPKDAAKGTGAGFTMPLEPPHGVAYFGCLPSNIVQEYEDRLEEIRDAIETLGLEDVKEYVFSAHVPARSSQAPMEPVRITQSHYGRMRDFTALITATVVQALPDLAEINKLLDTWDIRLTILRQVPGIYANIESTRAGIWTASKIIHDVEKGPLVTEDEVRATKAILGNKVSALGARVDKLLDMLEGEEDALPQSWIDSLEDIEGKYANWVVEAEKTAARNQTEQTGKHEAKETQETTNEVTVHELPASTPDLDSRKEPPSVIILPLPADAKGEEGGQNQNPMDGTSTKRKPMLEIKTAPSAKHNRGPSEVSMASNLSGYSLENAEIVDARTTQVLVSPKISVVDNPLRSSKDLSSWFGSDQKNSLSPPRPPVVQRASAASIEVIPKDQIKKVDLRRSWSHDMLAQMNKPRPSTPTGAFEQLTGQQSEGRTYSLDRRKSTGAILSSYGPSQPSTLPNFPSASTGTNEAKVEGVPAIPRRSSKRNTFHGIISPTTPKSEARSPVRATVPANTPADMSSALQSQHKCENTLEDKIREILISLPNKIKMADDLDQTESENETSQPATRSTSPVAVLKLSPAKDSKSKRDSNGGIRVYHLSKSGQKRDTAPIKLFVRAVGENGDRVMVRVGGGWADLAEYLREYSLHHGGRGLSDESLEVASFPEKQVLQPVPFPSFADHKQSLSTPGSANQPKGGRPADGSTGDGLDVSKVRGGSKAKSSEETATAADPVQTWTPPPVPPIPAFYTVQSPTTMHQTARGKSRMSIVAPVTPTSNSAIRSASSTSRRGTSTTTVTAIQTPSTTRSSYTPLGAAGPKSSGRRIVSHGTSRSVSNDRWVDNIVGKARAVSGNYSYTPTSTKNIAVTSNTASHTPMTTTTTVSMPNTPNRRASAFVTSTPITNGNNSSRLSLSAISLSSVGKNSVTPSTTSTSKDKGKEAKGSDATSSTSSRRKSRMSFGDMGGIKRVFLRKKSDK